MSLEQIDTKLRIIQESLDALADKSNDSISKKIKIQVLNIGFVRGDIEHLFSEKVCPKEIGTHSEKSVSSLNLVRITKPFTISIPMPNHRKAQLEIMEGAIGEMSDDLFMDFATGDPITNVRFVITSQINILVSVPNDCFEEI